MLFAYLVNLSCSDVLHKKYIILTMIFAPQLIFFYFYIRLFNLVFFISNYDTINTMILYVK